MEHSWSFIFGSALLASFVLFLVWFLVSRSFGKKVENSLDSRKRGNTILIAGPPKSGKTLLFQKLVKTDSPPLQSVHSLKENVALFEGKWTLVDLPFDSKKLHSQPADYFHFNDLTALILCFSGESFKLAELELIVTMVFSIGVLKQVPLCLVPLEHGSSMEKDIILSKLLDTLNATRKTRISGLLASNDSTATAVSFEDPINRLIFDSVDGEVSDYESRLREYFDEKLTVGTVEDIREWIESTI